MKNPPEKPSRASRNSAALTDKSLLRKRCGEDREAQCAERHEAVFDFAAGQISRRHAAQPDAERERDVEEADLGFVHPQHVRAVEEQIQQQQRPDEVEVGVAGGGEEHRTIFAPEADLRPHFAGEIRAELFARVRRRHARDAEAGEKSKHRQRDEDHPGPPLRAAKTLRHKRRRHGAEDDRRERAQFQQAVAPRKLAFRQQFRQQPVFRRAEKRAVDAHQEDTAEQRPAGLQ